MSNTASLKLIINTVTKDSNPVASKVKKVSDPRIQKLNTILGPKGIRADEVLKQFDALTEMYPPETPIFVYISATVDNKGKSISHKLQLGMVQTSYLVKKKLQLEKLASKPNNNTHIAIVDQDFIQQIIKEKTKHITISQQQYNQLFKCLQGTLKSFGIKYQNKI